MHRAGRVKRQRRSKTIPNRITEVLDDVHISPKSPKWSKMIGDRFRSCLKDRNNRNQKELCSHILQKSHIPLTSNDRGFF